MKALIAASLANIAFGSPLTNLLERRQRGSNSAGGGGIASLVGGLVNNGYGKVADPAGAAPRRVNMAPRATEFAGSKSIKVRYGPYKIPNMGHKNIVGEEGALWNYPDKSVDKPCDECVIVGMNAGLEYPDGSNANIDSGLWLHHFVVGPGRSDPTCINSPGSLPHMLIGSSPSGSERFFSSGNERTPAFLSQWSGIKNVGYHLKKTDKMAFIVDLMNENMEDKVAYLTVTYDFIPGTPAGYAHMQPVWFDAAQCSTSEVQAPRQNGSFTVTAKPWTANFNGEVLGSAGHLHDGGVDVKLDVAGQGTVCTSEATYGGSPEYVSKPGMNMGTGHGHSATKHISKMGVCIGPSFKTRNLEKGQVWTLKATYDYNKNPGMLHGDGKQSSVMGIAIMYVKVKDGETVRAAPSAKSSGGRVQYVEDVETEWPKFEYHD